MQQNNDISPRFCFPTRWMTVVYNGLWVSINKVPEELFQISCSCGKIGNCHKLLCLNHAACRGEDANPGSKCGRMIETDPLESTQSILWVLWYGTSTVFNSIRTLQLSAYDLENNRSRKWKTKATAGWGGGISISNHCQIQRHLLQRFLVTDSTLRWQACNNLLGNWKPRVAICC